MSKEWDRMAKNEGVVHLMRVPTTIQVKLSTKKKLDEIKERKWSYDDVITYILTENHRLKND